MNFSCDRCHKLYSIGDEKVQGRGFRVTCKQCGNVIVVQGQPGGLAGGAQKAGGLAGGAQKAPPGPPLAPPQPHPAAPALASPATRSTMPPPVAPRAAAPARPPVAPPAADLFDDAPPAPLEPRPDAAVAPAHHADDDAFFSSDPTHRPRHTAEWMLQDKKARSHPARLAWAGGLATLLVAGAVVFKVSGGVEKVWPPPASKTSRYVAPPPEVAPEPQTLAMPAEAVGGKAPEAAPLPVELPPEAPLVQRGAAPPRGVGGRAGFEAVGGGDEDDPRAQLRKRNLTIGTTDRKNLDLLQKKADASTVKVVEHAELDSGRTVLDAAAVRQTMDAARPAFGACVTRALKESPGLRVDDRRATLMLTIRPSGLVAKVWIAEADLDKNVLGHCLKAVSKRMVFPAFTGEEIEVAAPLALSAVH